MRTPLSRPIACAVALALLFPALPLAQAAKAGKSRTAGRLGYASKPATPSKAAAARARQRSVLASAPTPPSDRLASQIRQREGMGTGLVGIAFLLALMHSSSTSSADRAWLAQRIAALREDGESEEADLLEPVQQPVAFTFSPDRFVQGTETRLTVRAQRNGQAVPVACSMPGLPAGQPDPGYSVAWTPEAAGVQILRCEAGSVQASRLVRISKD